MRKLFIKIRKAAWLPFKFMFTKKKIEKNMLLKTRRQIRKKMDEIELKYLEAERRDEQEDVAAYSAQYEILNWLIT